MRISLLTVLVSPLTMRLNWEAETPIFYASSFCVMWFPFLGVKYHAWQFVTWQEHEAIMEDFFTHYRISDSRTPHLGHVGGRCGQAMFEDALVMSGLLYGDNVDA